MFSIRCTRTCDVERWRRRLRAYVKCHEGACCFAPISFAMLVEITRHIATSTACDGALKCFLCAHAPHTQFKEKKVGGRLQTHTLACLSCERVFCSCVHRRTCYNSKECGNELVHYYWLAVKTLGSCVCLCERIERETFDRARAHVPRNYISITVSNSQIGRTQVFKCVLLCSLYARAAA